MGHVQPDAFQTGGRGVVHTGNHARDQGRGGEGGAVVDAAIGAEAQYRRLVEHNPLFQRFHTQFNVRFRTAREFVREHAQNISRGGLFIQTTTSPPVDEVITVQLELPDGGPPATTSGLIMHRVTAEEAERTGTVPGIGVQFLDADDAFRDRIDRYIESLSAAQA